MLVLTGLFKNQIVGLKYKFSDQAKTWLVRYPHQKCWHYFVNV